MSARPRPVTSKFRAPQADHNIGPRVYALSSDGSTDSLISVLDRCSLEDLDDDSSDEEKVINVTNLPKDQTEVEKKVIPRKRPEKPPRRTRSVNDMNNKTYHLRKSASNIDDSSQNARNNRDTSNADVTESSQTAHELSCWESWLIEKAKEERQRLKREARAKRRKQEDRLRQERTEEEKKSKARDKYDKWLEETNRKVKTTVKQKEQMEKVKQDLEEAKKQEIDRKAKDNYEAWLNRKQNTQRENVEKQKEEKKKTETEKDEQRRRSDVAYESWRTRAASRPQSARVSYGSYSCGKHTSYYDNSALPTPTYYNPIPWHPIEIPQPKKKAKKKPQVKSSRNFNPSKYL